MNNKVIGVVAPKGSGKTTRVARLVSECDRVAVYDPMGETDIQYRMVATEIIHQDLKALHAAIAENSFRVLYEPALPIQDGDEWYYPDFREFLNKVWRRAQLIGPMTVVIDEAHYTMSKRKMPVEVVNIITNGRRYGLDIVWITQRFVGVNSWARANADEYWWFRLVHPADVDTVKEIAGPEVADAVQNLRRLDGTANPPVPGEMLVWNSLDGDWYIENQGRENVDRRTKDMDDSGTGGKKIPDPKGHSTPGREDDETEP
jgi:hypothetical protein